MPRTRSLHWTELKIGILSAASLAFAVMVIFMISGEGGFWWQRYRLKTRFDNVAGLKTGAPVRVAGVEVGSVKQVGFNGGNVEVAFEVSKEMQNRITDQSTALIGSISLLGESALDITPSMQGRPLRAGEYVPSKRSPGQLADVAEGATNALSQATGLLKEIRAGKGTVGKLFTDDALYRDVEGFVDAAEAVAQNLRIGKGTLGKLNTDDKVYRDLEASLQNLQAITTRINAGEGSLGKLLNDQTFANSLTSATSNVDSLASGINKGEGTAGKLVKDPALYNKMTALSDRLDSVLAGLNDGKGTAGQLLHDRQLYDNLNGAVTELRGLLVDIRKDPQKYLRVKVSIF